MMTFDAVFRSIGPCASFFMALHAALVVGLHPGGDGKLLGIKMARSAGRINSPILAQAMAFGTAVELPGEHILMAACTPLVIRIQQREHGFIALGLVTFLAGGRLRFDGWVVVTVETPGRVTLVSLVIELLPAKLGMVTAFAAILTQALLVIGHEILLEGSRMAPNTGHGILGRLFAFVMALFT